MNLKLIMALVADEKTEAVLKAARDAGATGATVVTNVRGEGLKKERTFLGLELTGQRDALMFLVAEPKAREILETIAAAAQLDDEPGAGIAFQLAIEDAVGLRTQEPALIKEIEDRI
ncbi:MAG: P-II family nitrogen regulator [Rhodospirillales bacterium]|nr:P-II family nitrogen regulator [Rhodospirillales bacterium]